MLLLWLYMMRINPQDLNTADWIINELHCSCPSYSMRSIFYFCTVQLLVAVSSDEFVEYETGVSTSFVEADIYVYEDARTDTGTGCTTGESNIGSCINLDDKNEQYLCDFVSREVFIASCKNTDCTDCEYPVPNEYGYQDDVCQSNGFLKAKCTDVLWEQTLASSHAEDL